MCVEWRWRIPNCIVVCALSGVLDARTTRMYAENCTSRVCTHVRRATVRWCVWISALIHPTTRPPPQSAPPIPASTPPSQRPPLELRATTTTARTLHWTTTVLIAHLMRLTCRWTYTDTHTHTKPHTHARLTQSVRTQLRVTHYTIANISRPIWSLEWLRHAPFLHRMWLGGAVENVFGVHNKSGVLTHTHTHIVCCVVCTGVRTLCQQDLTVGIT